MASRRWRKISADVAGIAASYDAYHAALAGKTPPEQAGFNGDQQFFSGVRADAREQAAGRLAAAAGADGPACAVGIPDGHGAQY